MIHSLSGGVLSDGGTYVFAKVSFPDGDPRWYLSYRKVKEGDRVIVPFGRYGEREGTVVRTEICTAHTAPVPLSRAQEIIKIV